MPKVVEATPLAVEQSDDVLAEGEEKMVIDEPEDEEDEKAAAGPLRIRQLELQEAIRSGCKAGMGSRQNAPAEWIGESLSFIVPF